MLPCITLSAIRKVPVIDPLSASSPVLALNLHVTRNYRNYRHPSRRGTSVKFLLLQTIKQKKKQEYYSFTPVNHKHGNDAITPTFGNGYYSNP